MHGLILRAFQGYVTATFGPAEWDIVLARAGLAGERFEPLLSSGPDPLRRVLGAASRRFGRTPDTLLEETGAFTVTNPAQPALRRLLLLGGATFDEFLYALEELPDRARLALPGLDFPRIELVMSSQRALLLHCHGPSGELVQVMLGALRAMADEYGTPAVIEPLSGAEGEGGLSIMLGNPPSAEACRSGSVSRRPCAVEGSVAG